MKKSFLIGSLMLLCATLAQAQQKVYIQLNDTTIERYVWDVVDITFGEDNYELQSTAPDAPVDLGLKVLWAPFNLTATTTNPAYAGQTFTHFGWGDLTGINQSAELRYFPVNHPTANIVNDDTRDIAKKLWGDKWRLPTDKEIQELITKCEWTWGQDAEGNWGYTVTGPNGNEIFLPADGQRLKSEITGQSEIGSYWTGVYNTDDDTTAYSLTFNRTEQPSLEAIKRYYGLLIRPVYGEEGLEASSSVAMLNYRNDHESIYLNQANFRATYTLSGDADKADEYGLLWGSSSAQLQYGGSCNVEKGSETLQEGENVIDFYLAGLNDGSSYKVRPYVLVEGLPKYGEELTFKTASRFPEPAYVDMGLSVRWAEWDMGAQSTNDFGLYFGWGDVSGDMTSTNPYDYATGFTGTSISNTKFDVAHVKWGKKWRMPTEAEYEELFENCTWTWEERNSHTTGEKVRGYCLTSKISKNSIFLPAGGYYTGTKSDRVNSYVIYWTADMDTETSYPVYYRLAASPIRKTNPKTMRTLFRAVYAEPTDPSNYGGSGGTVTPDDPVDPIDDPIDDPVDDPVTPKITPGKAVDLGLSVKWANYNIGAASETEAGYYIAWADTVPREDFSRNSHIHYDVVNKTYDDLGKAFNANGDYTYDAARYLWGGTWRVPTEVEFSELWLECTWTWTTKNGVDGFTVKGPSGKSIFLPAAGYKSGATGSTKQDGIYGYYWSSSLNLRNTDYGLNFMFNSGLQSLEENPTANPMPGTYREWGLNIRPVCP